MTDQYSEAPASADGDAHDAPVSLLHDVVSRAPLSTRDRIPSILLNVQGLVVGFASPRNRFFIGVAAIGMAVTVGVVLAGARLLEMVFSELDVIALVGLFVVNWVGNGGILVPIPGARMIGLLMIVQNAVVLPPVEVVSVAGAAMALGLLSYYTAGARATRAYQRGDVDQADQLATDSGLLTPTDAKPTPLASFSSAGIDGPPAAQDAAAGTTEGLAAGPPDESRRSRVLRRFAASWGRALERAQPAVEKHGLPGMFWLCFAPTPLGTAGAFLGGAMGFGFSRYLLASFAAKYLLAVLIVIIAVVASDGANSLLGGR